MKQSLIANSFVNLMKGAEMSPPIRNASPFFQCSGWNQDTYFAPYYESRIQYATFVNKDAHGGSMYLPLTAMKIMAKEVFAKYWSNPEFLQERNVLAKGFIKTVDDLYEEVSYEFVKRHSFEESAAMVEKMKDATWHMNAILHFSIYFDKELCWKTLSSLKTNISQKRLDFLWENMSILAADSFETRREKQILRYYLKNLSDDKLVNKCQYFEANYGYVPGYNETLERLNKKYGLLKGNAREVLQKFEKEFQIKREQFDEWYQRLSFEEQRLADFLQYIMEARDVRKDPIGKTLAVLYRLAEPLFKTIELDCKYIFYCSYFEILRGSKYLKSIQEEIRERKDVGVSFFIPYHGVIEKQNGLFNENKKKIENFIFSQAEQPTQNVLRGQIAFRGVVQGEVKIIRHLQKEQHNFRDGQILVTGMTRPEYVPLMRKAKAVVTEEGGITCHAAIVSRELKKPCIIGTKIATKVLKDGDMVEVDANKGTVKILKRA